MVKLCVRIRLDKYTHYMHIHTHEHAQTCRYQAGKRRIGFLQVRLAGFGIGRCVLGIYPQKVTHYDASTKEWVLVGVHLMPVLYIALLGICVDDIGAVYVSISIVSLTVRRIQIREPILAVGNHDGCVRRAAIQLRH